MYILYAPLFFPHVRAPPRRVSKQKAIVFDFHFLCLFLPFISVQSSIFPFLPTNKLPSYLMPIPYSILSSVSPPLPLPLSPALL
jgi:hypothetical protein